MSCFACIDNDELGAVESCGKFLYIRDGGCHFLGCNYLGLGYSVRKISARIQQNNVTCETKTADDVFVVIKVSVQMEVMKDHAYEAIYKLTDPHQQIESYVANVVRGELPKMKLDEVFTQKEELAKACRVDVEAKMKEFGYFIHNVQVIEIEPAAIVKKAMNEKARTRSRALTPSIRILSICLPTCMHACTLKGSPPPTCIHTSVHAYMHAHKILIQRESERERERASERGSERERERERDACTLTCTQCHTCAQIHTRTQTVACERQPSTRARPKKRSL